MFAKKMAAMAAAMAVVAALVAPALTAVAETTSPAPADKLVQRYTALAGSEENARALVNGLRDGSRIKLSNTTFDPPTQKMGYGNIDNALSLAEASLKEKGITNPTPEQLKTSLMGILQLRAEGKGWGQIADALGFKLGEVKRPERIDRVKPERPERPERPHKPERPERPGK
jgi:hypothetical protein